MARLALLILLACAASMGSTQARAADISQKDFENAALLLGNLTGAFKVFKEIYNKAYAGGSEDSKRYLNFASNLINAAGALSARNPNAKFGVTPYSDLSEEEFAQTYLTAIPTFTQEDAEQLCNKSDPDSCDASITSTARRSFGAKNLKGEHDHRVDYADLPEEFRTRKAYQRFAEGNQQSEEGSDNGQAPPARAKAFAGAADLPTQWDWRTKGVVGPIKYQGECGSCWSFVVAANIESLWAIAGHGIPDLSVQQLLSCVSLNQACGGGIMQYAYDWIVRSNSGYMAAAEYYPYVSADESHVPACNNEGAGAAAFINKYVSISRNEASLKEYVANVGPVSVAIEAYGWQSYTGGIITDCNNLMTTHAVVVVGYDTVNDPPYWICKNSWSDQWGENGYIRVKMGANVCLIADNPSTGLITGELADALPTGDPARRASPNGAAGLFTLGRAIAAITSVVAAGVALVL